MRDIEELLTDYITNEVLTPEEQEQLNYWLTEPEHAQQFKDLYHLHQLTQAAYSVDNTDYDLLWNKIQRGIHRKLFVWKMIQYAALLFIPLFSLLAIYLLQNYSPNNTSSVLFQNHDHICLLLSSGEQRILNQITDTLITETNGIRIHQQKNALNYQINTTKNMDKNIYNTLYIPRGAEFQLILQDGTKVWLNAESELRYPLAFTEKERKIYLKGEAFFEVAPDSLHPFIVLSEKAKAIVLGTKFNFRSYADETSHITLTEGSLQVIHCQDPQEKCILTPGDNAQIEQILTLQKNIDITPYISWHTGYFCFKNEPLKNILYTLERWYDFQTVYADGQPQNYTFTGWFNRNEPFEKIMHQLEQTNRIKITIQNQIVTIYDSQKNREMAPTTSR